MLSRFTRRQLEYLIGASIGVIAFIMYVKTVCPTVNFIDSGELATVAYTLGIAHPTGYPLFTLVGWAFSHLPLGFRPIYQLNLMAAFFCAFGLFFFFRFLVFFLGEFTSKEQKDLAISKKAVTEENLIRCFIPAAAGTLFLAFSETYWSQALSIEVYSLHVFFLAILLLLFTKAINSGRNSAVDSIYQRNGLFYWYCFAFVLGLSFTNHMTTILLAPAFLYLYFYTFRFRKESWLRIFRMTFFFLAGFSAYCYLPFRASEHPLMNWGNPTDLERFMWHFSGKVYRVWLFSSTESAGKQLKYFVDGLPAEFSYVPHVFAAIGLWNLFRRRKAMFIFTLLLFFGCLLYSINYDIHDIDSYFLLAYLTVAIWSACGVRHIIGVIKNPNKLKIVSAVLLASSVILIVSHYHDVDESKTLLVEDYTKDMFNSVEPNGIIISYQWDYFVSAAYYYQLVEHMRPDVVVIDKELLRRSWYYKQLERRYPWLIEQSKKEVDAFLSELYKFEHDLQYNSTVIEYRYASLIKSFIGKNYPSRPVYVTQELEPQYTTGYKRIPSGLAYRLTSDTSIKVAGDRAYTFHPPSKSNKYIEGILSLYSQSYLNQAMYAYSNGQVDQANVYLDKALEIQPNSKDALLQRDRIRSGK